MVTEPTVVEQTNDVLRQIDELFADESCWTQRALARTAEGNLTAPTGDLAVAWCLSGGIYKIIGIFDSKLRFAVYERLVAETHPRRELSDFNDHATFAEVKALIKAARS